MQESCPHNLQRGYRGLEGENELAYFTDPMGDEFKKAIEEAMKDMEEEKSVADKPKKAKKKRTQQYSRKTKLSLK